MESNSRERYFVYLSRPTFIFKSDDEGGKANYRGDFATRKEIEKEAKEIAINLLNDLGIHEAEKRFEQYPHQLSGGMRQRICLAIAFACHPKLVIADEPTTALDVTIQKQIMELLKERKEKKNTSILLITHDLALVREVADRVVVMYGGRVVEKGTIEEVIGSPKHPYTKSLLQAIPNMDDSEKYYVQ